MKLKTVLAAMSVLSLLNVAAALAETTVTLSDVHLCCNNCVKGVDTAVAPVSGTKATCDKDAGTIGIFVTGYRTRICREL